MFEIQLILTSVKISDFTVNKKVLIDRTRYTSIAYPNAPT